MLKLDQQVADCPSIGTTDESLDPELKSKISNPTPASVARRAFVPSIKVIEKGRSPPSAGATELKSSDSDPSDATSQTARNPGVGGIPFTETNN